MWNMKPLGRRMVALCQTAETTAFLVTCNSNVSSNFTNFKRSKYCNSTKLKTRVAAAETMMGTVW
jgi:hypothetical protein